MSDFFKKIKELVFIPRCICCLKPADEGHLCSACGSQLAQQRIPEDKRCIDKKYDMVDKVYASYYYNGRASQAVKTAKFRNPASFLAYFADDISIDIMKIIRENNIDMLVAAPCHKSKFYSQEYDLPSEMTKRISVACNTEHIQCVVKKQKTPRQHNLPLQRRKVNLVNAFEVTMDLTGRKILIIDDVITTGITLSTLATEMKIAGADKVYAWVYTYNT